MVSKSNLKVRNCLKKHGVFQWQLAEELGIGEYTLTRRLRRELSEEEQNKLCEVISRMEVD